MFFLIQSTRCEELHLHAENLSRRVWELLMLLPTCPKMLQAFQNISDDTVSYHTQHSLTQLQNGILLITQFCVFIEWGRFVLEGAAEN